MDLNRFYHGEIRILEMVKSVPMSLQVKETVSRILAWEISIKFGEI